MHNSYSKTPVYELVETHMVLEGEDVVTCGISCAEQRTVNGITMDVTYVIGDISENREMVSAMVRRLNEWKLEAIHLPDVVSDMLFAG